MNKHLNVNKQFMIGNGLLAFAVIIVVAIFVYMSLRLNRTFEEKYEGIYEISLKEGFLNHYTEIHLNDSIIFDSIVNKEPQLITIKQFAAQGALIFVNKETGEIAIFNLSSEGGRYEFTKDSNTIQLISDVDRGRIRF